MTQDLVLAPLAVSLDANLRRLRDKPVDDIANELLLEFDPTPSIEDRAAREERIVEAATRNVELHGWQVDITADATRLHVSGGSVEIDLGLGATIAQFIEHGAKR